MNQLNNKLHENIGIQQITMMCVLPKSSYLQQLNRSQNPTIGVY